MAEKVRPAGRRRNCRRMSRSSWTATAAGRRRGGCRDRRAIAPARRRCGARSRRDPNRRGWLTLYAFSSENWRRPQGEVIDLTGLLRHYLRNEIAELTRRTACACASSATARRFDADIQADLAAAERDTAGNSALNLTIALSYGAPGRNRRRRAAALAAVRARAARSGRSR